LSLTHRSLSRATPGTSPRRESVFPNKFSVRRDLETGLWFSSAYFVASCGGAPLSMIKQYVEQEKNPL
jgi:REP element-mobilizing transposase RayT